ncbi:hypothetical protein ABID26_005075 [Mesorhizobium shonense]|uniref:Uncharacterized protein n=1 Tax=Mesorhizobium shonense TaxID=1209948 RepID=A0ABV2HYI7_9HYPH
MTNWPTAAIAHRPKFRINDRSLGLILPHHSRAAADEVPTFMHVAAAVLGERHANKDLKRVA